MALAKTDYLYRVRILFEPDGSLSLVETVNKEVVTEDGAVIHSKDSTVQTYPVAHLAAAVQTLLAEIKRVGADEAQRVADAAKAAAEAAATKAAETPSA